MALRKSTRAAEKAKIFNRFQGCMPNLL